jgi:phosphopantetheinyl transferase
MLTQPLLFGYGLLDGPMIAQSDNYLQCLDSCEQSELVRRNYKVASRSAQYIYGRLLLKIILSPAMGVSARSLSIRTGTSGQPLLLASSASADHLSVSISHDRDRLFVAACSRCRCGVDIQALHGVDWPLVMRAMGWSERVEHCFRTAIEAHGVVCMNLAVFSAMIWSAYEAWMKVTVCALDATDFVWQRISLIETDPVTHYHIFEMALAERRPYNQVRILLSLRSNEVLAVATVAS